MTDSAAAARYFVTYSGVQLPFKLVNELTEAELDNRNTYFSGHFDTEGRLTGFDKIVYGELELTHRYVYRDNGALMQATITDADEETTTLDFDDGGQPR